MAGINLSSGFNASLEKPLDLRTVVQDLTERDNIDSVKRYDGLEVYVIDEQTKYRLEGGTDNSDWVETGGTNINSIDDINDVSISSVSSGNLLEYDGSDWVNVEKSTIDIGEFNDDGTYLSSVPTLQEVTEQGNTTDQTVQITGSNNSPSSGKGIEIGYSASSDYARIRSDDKDNRIFKPLILQGSETRIEKGDVSIEDGNLKVDGTGDSYIKGSLGLGGITDPSEALEVDGNGKFSGDLNIGGDLEFSKGEITSDDNNTGARIIARAKDNPSDGDAIFAVESSRSATRFGVTQSYGAWLRDNLKVGYTYDEAGLPSPDYKLEVKGDILVYGGDSGETGSLSGDSLIVIENDSNAYVEFRTPSADYAGLYFTDNTGQAGGIEYGHNSSNDSNKLMFGAWSSISFRIGADNGVREKPEVVTINNQGDITADGEITAEDFILSSDIRFKENIKPLNLKGIEEVEIKNFNFIDTPDKKRVGVVAQELEKVRPEYVHEDEQGYLSVSYISLLLEKVAYLENEIKELKGN